MKTTLKLSINIEQDTKFGCNVTGEFNVTDMIFSDLNNLLDAESMIADVKKCLKLLKGFKMLTIRLTDGIQYESYPTEIHSVRFTNHYGEIKMAYANKTSGHNCYTNWEIVKEKDIYDNIRTFVQNANILQVGKIRESVNTEVAAA